MFDDYILLILLFMYYSFQTILQSLCDLDVTTITPEHNLTFIELLANALPSSQQMSSICRAMAEHVSNREHSFSSVLTALRTMLLLMYHDYGFYHVKK